MSSSQEKLLILKSSDKKEFVVKESVAVQSITIRNLVEDGCDSDPIPLVNVDSKNLALVIEFMEKHADSTLSYFDKKEFDSQFANKPLDEVLVLALAANYLNIRELLDMLFDILANQIQHMTVENVQKLLDIQGDDTEEEEKGVRAENDWAFN
ncbi:SKP1-like protein 11 [Abeliophyllum distichum]|uniref:SKP1-like protein n=1 Tax=Abeliophyllum distichum TaxID=126358 RepID=A0ABD1VQQ1_9LAMI